MTSIKRASWFAVSFLMGSAIGGAIALLYAPESGRHLRKDIRKKTNEYIEDGKKIASDTWNDAKETAESALESANDFLNSGMEKIMRQTEKAKDALKSGYNAFNDERKSEINSNSSSLESNKNTHKQKA
jgi:gas vesicle protein